MFLLLIALIVLACMKRQAWRRHQSWGWGEHQRAESGEPAPTVEEQFEEWHRMMHDHERGTDDAERV